MPSRDPTTNIKNAESQQLYIGHSGATAITKAHEPDSTVTKLTLAANNVTNEKLSGAHRVILAARETDTASRNFYTHRAWRNHTELLARSTIDTTMLGPAPERPVPNCLRLPLIID